MAFDRIPPDGDWLTGCEAGPRFEACRGGRGPGRSVLVALASGQPWTVACAGPGSAVRPTHMCARWDRTAGVDGSSGPGLAGARAHRNRPQAHGGRDGRTGAHIAWPCG